MVSRLQLALRDAIGEAVFAAESGGAGPRHEVFLRLVDDAETENLPDDPRDWFRQLLECELPNPQLTSTLVVEFLSRSAVSGCGGVEVVIGSNRLRWSCKTFT